MPELNPGGIQEAYQSLILARKALAKAREAEIQARNSLEKQRLLAIAEERIDGKNEDMRKAQARSLLADLHEGYENAAAVVRQAQTLYEIAQLRVEYLKSLIQFND